jgi:hypothetical protein
VFDPNSIISKLSTKDSKQGYVAIKASEVLPFYIGKDIKGEYALILLTSSINSETPYKTKFLSLSLIKNCSLQIEGQVTEIHDAYVLHCHTIEQPLCEKFITLAATAASQCLAISPASDYLFTFFTDLAELFKIRSTEDFALKRQGLWGELFFMYKIGNFNRWIESWHQDPTSRFDFTKASKRTEVKTTLKDDRIHSFSHSQLCLNTGTEGIVISMKLVPTTDGLSLRDLINYATSTIGDNWKNRLKLEKEVMRTNMLDEKEWGPIFDEENASQNMKPVWISQIPKFHGESPVGVFNCRYDSDLSIPPAIGKQDFIHWVQNW